MKEWFQNLPPRDRILAVIGGVWLSVVILYLAIWSPLTSRVDKLTKNIEQKKSDIVEMKQQSQKIKALLKTNPNKLNTKNRSLVSIIDTSLQKAGLKDAMEKMEPDGSKNAKIWFKEASFDALINMLGSMESETGIAVKTINITRGESDGLVDARVTVTTL